MTNKTKLGPWVRQFLLEAFGGRTKLGAKHSTELPRCTLLTYSVRSRQVASNRRSARGY